MTDTITLGTIEHIDPALVASIREFGVLEPVVCRRSEDGTVSVRMGQRRVLAAREAERATVPACFEPQVAGRFSSYGVMLSHVAAGLSVGVLPELAVPTSAGIVARPVRGLADRRIVAAVRAGAARRLALEAVMGAVRASAPSARQPG